MTIPGVRPATALVVILAIITGANLFTEPYLLTNGGGPDGASASPVLVMYQKGIEQGNPDVASAIGVILVLGVLAISLISRRAPGEGLTWPHDRATGASPPPTPTTSTSPRRRSCRAASTWAHRPFALLALGALVFLFPFYYMLVGSLQAESDTSVGGAFPIGGWTLRQLQGDQRARRPARSLVNSGIFTGGVILTRSSSACSPAMPWPSCTSVAGACCSPSMLLVQLVPFQLLMIPLYVMIVRSYGLADTYLGMILPFAINSTAVFIFRQFFLQLPEDLFSAARIDGAGELRILWSIALPLVRPALLTAVLLTFIGPWNEFLWPFLITKDTDMQPLAVSLANYLSNVAGRGQQPVRRDPRRSGRAGRPGRRAVRGVPAALHLLRPRLRREGLTGDPSHAAPPSRTR